MRAANRAIVADYLHIYPSIIRTRLLSTHTCRTRAASTTVAADEQHAPHTRVVRSDIWFVSRPTDLDWGLRQKWHKHTSTGCACECVCVCYNCTCATAPCKNPVTHPEIDTIAKPRRVSRSRLPLFVFVRARTCLFRPVVDFRFGAECVRGVRGQSTRVRPKNEGNNRLVRR